MSGCAVPIRGGIGGEVGASGGVGSAGQKYMRGTLTESDSPRVPLTTIGQPNRTPLRRRSPPESSTAAHRRPDRRDQSSTQSKVFVTAFFQFRYSFSRRDSSIDGSHCLSFAQLVRMSSSDSQNPTASPAA